MQRAFGKRDDLTFKGNLSSTRHGWLRLTPAYSVKLVGELLDQNFRGGRVLDPFCGTGTTALVCGERGISADTTDINPFLLWLADAKTRPCGAEELQAMKALAEEVARAMEQGKDVMWLPAIHRIEKWWSPGTFAALSRGLSKLKELALRESGGLTDLLKIAFCRTLIERANVSFGHQSMSFKKRGAEPPGQGFEDERQTADSFRAAIRCVEVGATSSVRERPRALACDARDLSAALEPNTYSCVITSPPYPNRMSYVRELRPYMYWLGYLSDRKGAGELDWQAIGGTWGSATSQVAKWSPSTERRIPFDDFKDILEQIHARSAVLSRYVHKYFYDMLSHLESLYPVVQPGGTVHYIVGNSKFFDVMLPVEQIFAALFASVGFCNTEIRTIRKRTSKRELFEFVVSARKA